MRTALHFIILSCGACSLTAQQTIDGLPTNTPAPPVQDQPTAAAQEQQLSQEERHIRAGITLLGALHDTLASIQDRESADAAVDTIRVMTRRLQTWAQEFSGMPLLDKDTQQAYEDRYLPIIQEINKHIALQGTRIASAEFYGSRDLPNALVEMVHSVL